MDVHTPNPHLVIELEELLQTKTSKGSNTSHTSHSIEASSLSRTKVCPLLITPLHFNIAVQRRVRVGSSRVAPLKKAFFVRSFPTINQNWSINKPTRNPIEFLVSKEYRILSLSHFRSRGGRREIATDLLHRAFPLAILLSIGPAPTSPLEDLQSESHRSTATHRMICRRVLIAEAPR